MKINRLVLIKIFSLAIISSLFVATTSHAEDAIDCDESNCNDLAKQYLENDDITKAIQFHIKGCELNDSASCYNIATIYTEDYYVERDFLKAVPFYKKSCKLNDNDACTDLADEYDDLEDYANALVYSDAACQRNDAHGCHLQGWILDNNITPRDLERATALYTKSCELGHGWSCNNLGYDYMGYDDEPNPYTPKDYTKGIQLMTLACDTYSVGSACTSLSYAYENGHGVKKNPSESLRYMIKSCEGVEDNFASACLNLGLNYEEGVEVKKDMEKAQHYYEKGCEFENSDACYNAALNLDYGIGITQNDKKAHYFYQQACELGDDDGCEKIAN